MEKDKPFYVIFGLTLVHIGFASYYLTNYIKKRNTSSLQFEHVEDISDEEEIVFQRAKLARKSLINFVKDTSESHLHKLKVDLEEMTKHILHMVK